MTAWLLNESALIADADITEILADRLIFVPSHWPIEVSNALRTSLRSGRLGPADFNAIVDRLDRFRISVEPSMHLDEIMPLAQFAADHGLTTCDAAYVQLAVSRRFLLASLDQAMRRAAIGLGAVVVPA